MGATVVTQNVDGLHMRAGSTKVLEVHGSIWTLRCVACGVETGDRRTPLPELPPRCGRCGRGILRPGVVWFGESLPQAVWEEAERAASEAEVFLVVGTSAQVYPAAGLASLTRGFVIEINPDATGLSDTVDASIRGTAGEILPQLV